MEKGDGSVVIVVDADSRDAEKKLKEVAKKAQNLQNDLQKGKNIVFHLDVSEADKEMHRLQTNISRLQERVQEKGLLLSGTKAEYSQLESKFNEAKLSKNVALAESIAKDLDTLDKKAQSYEAAISESNTKIEAQKTLLAQVSKAIAKQAQQAEAAAEAAKARRDAEIDAMVDKALAREKEKAEENAAASAAWEAERATKQTAKYSQETAEAYKNFRQVSEQIRKSEEQDKAAQNRKEIDAAVQSRIAAAQETARIQAETEREAQRYIDELNRANVPLSKLEKSYEAQKRKIQQTVQKIQELRAQQEELQKSSARASEELDKSTRKLQEIQASGADKKSPELLRQQESVRALSAEYNRVQSQMDGYNRRIMDSERNLRRQVNEAGELSERIQQANSPAGKLSGAFAKATSQVGKLTKRIAGLAKRVFIFSLITSALRSVREYIGGVIKNNAEAAASIAQLKGAFLTLAQPIMETVLPVFVKLLNVLTRIVQIMANLVSRLFGKSVTDMANNAKNLNKQLNGTSKAADKAAGSLASFDEINQLSNQDSSSSGGASSDAIAPDFSGFSEDMQSELDKLTAIVAGAALAVGAILALSGINIPLGIGLMAIGAAVLYEEAKLYWDKLPTQIQDKINGFLVIAGIVALAIGLLLALSGVNIPLGIGLIALGAAALVSAAALNWDDLGNTVSEKLAAIGAIIGPVIAVVGVILMLTGHIIIGIACIVAGIAIFGISAANLNWDMVGGKVRTILGTIFSVVGPLIAIIGVVLLLTGNIPLGIAGIIAGIAIFSIGSVSAQWDSVPNTVKDKLALILKVIGGSLIVLGVILLLTGVGASWGFGCILAGIGALSVSAIVPNWNFIWDKIKEAWGNIKAWWNRDVAQYFTLSYWQDKASSIIDGLSAGIRAGVGKIKDALSSTLSSAWDKVSSTASGIWDSLTGSKKGGGTRSAVAPQLTTARVEPAKIPALAKGAVIPANREFLAVLGDQSSGRNLEAPESLIRQIVREESGGANTQLLQAILDAIREGQVIMVDKQQLGRTVQSSLTSMQRAGLIKV